jgi:trans-aconitate methyltransferase
MLLYGNTQKLNFLSSFPAFNSSLYDLLEQRGWLCVTKDDNFKKVHHQLIVLACCQPVVNRFQEFPMVHSRFDHTPTPELLHKLLVA